MVISLLKMVGYKCYGCTIKRGRPEISGKSGQRLLFFKPELMDGNIFRDAWSFHSNEFVEY